MNETNVDQIIQDIEIIKDYLPNNIDLHNLIKIGGQGVVYKGVVDGYEAAIKFYFSGQVEKRIDREINTLRTFNHPNIVQLLWDGEISIHSKPIKIVACEFINGKELNSLIKENPLTWKEIGSLVYFLCQALDALWEERIVHRDLKPENIMIRNNGAACLIDLGYARHIDKSSQTAIGQTFGTPGYLSPEQARCERQLTTKSDIFTLGIIMIECKLGHHPTYKDQKKLLDIDFVDYLPNIIDDNEFLEALKKMLNPDPVLRPLPDELFFFSKYLNREE